MPPRDSARTPPAVAVRLDDRLAGAAARDQLRPAVAAAAGRTRRDLTVLLRLLEAVAVVALYRVYAALRNAQGEGQPAPGPTATARAHGVDVLRLERLLHLDIEHGVQAFALARPLWVIRTADLYYAGVHLPLTALVLGWLLVGRPAGRSGRWRAVLLVGTGLSLIGFALFPTMPPRLLPVHPPYVATLGVYGGLWSHATPMLEHIEHPYAAIPSLHLLWALWTAVALWRYARSAWVRALGPAHVALTATVVLMTGNHWVLDLVAGALVFLAAVVLVEAVSRRLSRPPGRS